jgi:hypothetical protein
MQAFEIPLVPSPQRFAVQLGGTGYSLTFQFRNAGLPEAGGTWVVDIGDSLGNPLVCGIPLVTGADLLAQYAYLNFGGALVVTSDGDPDAVPTFDNLGITSHLYWVSLP